MITAISTSAQSLASRVEMVIIPRQVGRGVAQVLSVGLSALLVKVDEDQLLANALVEQGVGRRRADIAGANNHHFTGFGVHIQISSTNGRG
ncbi:Uncharacterised protein [Klebsiella pneumoniae]|uniref:Uncharacterized protein n=1 Tax=Klebsiella pneumoniae TaxID=573 RepID=A0A2X3EXV9_KLEPN|nr:Uncharacterised protein [Klebsiella pneumoniae]